jgi:hypothetical protein
VGGDRDAEVRPVAVGAGQHRDKAVGHRAAREEAVSEEAEESGGEGADHDDREVLAEDGGEVGVAQEVDEQCRGREVEHEHVQRVDGVRAEQPPTAHQRSPAR